MLTQLEKLSEGNEPKGASVNVTDEDGQDDATVTPFTLAERLTRVRSSALLNPAVLTSR